MNETNLPTIEQLLEAADRKVKELVRAIHCLPKPPDGMGDGPDERVGYVLDLVARVGKAISKSSLALHLESNHAADFSDCCRTECAEARALLEETKK